MQQQLNIYGSDPLDHERSNSAANFLIAKITISWSALYELDGAERYE